jgi:hypothetical protein
MYIDSALYVYIPQWTPYPKGTLLSTSSMAISYENVSLQALRSKLLLCFAIKLGREVVMAAMVERRFET